jgi:hypothetical protein
MGSGREEFVQEGAGLIVQQVTAPQNEQVVGAQDLHGGTIGIERDFARIPLVSRSGELINTAVGYPRCISLAGEVVVRSIGIESERHVDALQAIGNLDATPLAHELTHGAAAACEAHGLRLRSVL